MFTHYRYLWLSERNGLLGRNQIQLGTNYSRDSRSFHGEPRYQDAALDSRGRGVSRAGASILRNISLLVLIFY